jgi:hypothetical protein
MTLITPPDIVFLFLAIVLSVIILFYRASRSIGFVVLAVAWCVLQSIIAITGFYVSTSLPPRLLLGIVPTLVLIAFMFFTRKGRAFIDGLSLEKLTWFHVIRIPVEISLSLLYHFGFVSVWQTMEGTNFDLLSGLTAPLVGWYAFRGTRLRRRLLLWWNVVCLLLLMNVVITSILVMPGPLQKIGFFGDHFAVQHFPFALLPTFIVPLVLFAHLAAIRRLQSNRF